MNGLADGSLQGWGQKNPAVVLSLLKTVARGSPQFEEKANRFAAQREASHNSPHLTAGSLENHGNLCDTNCHGAGSVVQDGSCIEEQVHINERLTKPSPDSNTSDGPAVVHCHAHKQSQ